MKRVRALARACSGAKVAAQQTLRKAWVAMQCWKVNHVIEALILLSHKPQGAASVYCAAAAWLQCALPRVLRLHHVSTQVTLIQALTAMGTCTGDESDGFEFVDSEDLDGEAEATGAQRPPGRRAAAERPLPVALPASLGLEPARLSSMRSSLFQTASTRPLEVTGTSGFVD